MKEIHEEERGRQTAHSGVKYVKYTDVSVGKPHGFFLTSQDVLAVFPHQVTAKCWITFRRLRDFFSSPVRGFD